MNFVQVYINFWKNFADFQGRATRTDFWVPAIVHTVAMMFLWVFTVIFFPFIFVLVLFAMAILVPGISLAIRRLHDTDRGTMQILWLLLPILGALYLLAVCGFIAGTPHENQFGPDPHESLQLA